MSATYSGSDLEFVVVCERDHHGDDLIAWAFPGKPDDETCAAILSRSEMDISPAHASPALVSSSSESHWTRQGPHWLHTFTIRDLPAIRGDWLGRNAESDGVPEECPESVARVESVCVCVSVRAGSVFCPERWLALAEVMARGYGWNGDAVRSCLKPFLSAQADREVRVLAIADDAEANDGALPSGLTLAAGSRVSLSPSTPPPRHSLLKCPLSPVASLLGAEQTALLWAAVVTRKRVVVVGKDRNDIETVVRSAPLMAWHRQDWAVCAPYQAGTKAEVGAVLRMGVFVAGFGKNGQVPVDKLSSICDLLVDIDAASVTVSPKARPVFKLGRIGREISDTFGRLAAGEMSEKEGIKSVAVITEQVVEKAKEGGVGGGIERFMEAVQLAES